MAVNVKVGLIGPLDMLKFKNMAKVREDYINAAPANEITADYRINTKARLLHPDFQKLVVSEIIDHPEAFAKTYVFKAKNGGPLAYFRAGQYISLKMKIGESFISRPYSICSAPKDALDGKICITVQSKENGFAADYILANTAVGDEFTASGPQGNFYYEELRDAPNVLALAGGSGITPFLSMARAIADGTEDFRLTILYGNRTEDQILFKDELDDLDASCDKIKVVHVLSDEVKEGFETGFITADLIRRYAPESVSLFICGPEAMYRFLADEILQLDLPGKNVRREIMGVRNVENHPNFPKEAAGKRFKITVRQGANTYIIPAAAEESILVAIERAGIIAPSRCRAGECGWCRSKVLSGEFFAPEENESRRYSDRTNDYIHPCVTFPVSDLVVEVPAEYV
ncbi:MAG: iron-sulfur cluster-binding domain-containing protein [Lachnospiraceae bacterium]|nr:iron-sulfur cluster-binding domain-containing protein [Lachnospiraceae bacterium]